MRTIKIYPRSIYIITLLILPVLCQATGQDSYTVYETMLAQNGYKQESAGSDVGPGASASSISEKPADLSVDEIAKELSNPVTALASIRTDVEYRTYQGDLPGAGDQSNVLFLFRPSVPIPLRNGKNILMRATIPVYVDMPAWKVPFGHPLWIQDFDYPDFRLRQSPQITESTGEFASLHGHLGDVGLDFAYGGVSDSGFISMYGLATVFSTSQNVSASRNQWLLGPQLAFGKSTDWGVIGAWWTQLVGVSSEFYSYDTNETLVEFFFAYGLGNGWQVISNPVLTYDWEADSGNEVLLPVGVGISKTTRMGSTPVKFELEIQKFIVSPDRFGTDWMLTFSFTPVIPNPFSR